MKPDGMTD